MVTNKTELQGYTRCHVWITDWIATAEEEEEDKV